MLLDATYPYLLLDPETPAERAALLSLPFVGHLAGGRLGAVWTRLPAFSGWSLRCDTPEAQRRVQDLQQWVKVSPLLEYLRDADFSAERAVFSADYPPRDYQLSGVRHLVTVRRALLGDAMGLGKTVQAAGAVLADWYARPDAPGKFVVICPSGLRRQWRRELTAAFVSPHTSAPAFKSEGILVYDGAPSARKLTLRMLFEPQINTFVISYELLLRDREQVFQALRQTGVRALIVDESGRVKNPLSVSYAAVRALSEAHPSALCFLLNGTPIENTAEDLWAQMSIVRPELFPSMADFEARYVRKTRLRTRQGQEYVKIVGYQNLDEMKSLIRDVLVRRSYDDVSEELPQVVTVEKVVELGATQRAAYAELEADQTMASDVKLTALVRAALFHRAPDGGFVSVKSAAVMEVLSELGEREQVVVCSASKVFVREMVKLMRAEGIRAECIDGETSDAERAELVSAFTVGSFRVLLGTSAIERGLNLQAAGVLIQADLPWNPAVWLQRLGRIRRMGSRHAVARVVQIIADDTVESYVRKVVYLKQRLFAGVVGELDVAPVTPDATKLLHGLTKAAGRA